MKSQHTKKYIAISLLCAVVSGTVLFSACSLHNTKNSADQNSNITQNSSDKQTSLQDSEQTKPIVSDSAVSFESDDLNAVWNEDSSTKINLSGSSMDVSGNGASVSGNTLTISSAGTYIISGDLNDGQIFINAGKDDIVKLVLNNASVSSSSAPAIYAENAKKTVIILADGTTNRLSDGNDYVSENPNTSSEDSDSPNASLFCRDDLTITGNGTLEVKGNANNGITSKDILRIANGTINVDAKNNGITGRDNVAIIGGTITVNTSGDGIRSTYSETDDSSKGHIFIENSVISITSDEDGIQAEKDIILNSGTLTVTTGGGSDSAIKGSDTNNHFGFGRPGESNQTSTDSVSRKAIKAGTYIAINDGTFNINSYDDSLHSNGTVEINGGNINISAGDDAIHADDTLSIKNGNIKIINSYEGLEANIIDISGGVTELKSTDDGINAAGGNDSSGFGGGRPQDNFQASSSTAQLNIRGGSIYINADGDGIDSNAAININGGTIIINGTTSTGNGIIDHDGKCEITGGVLIGSGTSDMIEMPETTSSQNSVAVMFNERFNSGTLVYIVDKNGDILTAITPLKDFDCVIFSSPLLKTGETYSVYFGGSASGESFNGYYSNASVTDGTKYTEFTISESVTYVNENGVTNYTGGFGGGGMHNGGGGFGGGGMRNGGGVEVRA